MISLSIHAGTMPSSIVSVLFPIVQRSAMTKFSQTEDLAHSVLLETNIARM